MSEQESSVQLGNLSGSVEPEQNESNWLTLDTSSLYVRVPQPDHLVLRDETGQTWAITVATDGQLQTAKHPDGGLEAEIGINLYPDNSVEID
jgi:hypothetical protein